MEMRSVVVAGARLSCWESCEQAPDRTHPALLVHRAGGSSRDWVDLMQRIGSERRLVAPDLPGHGRSPGRPLDSIEQMAEIVGQLADRLEISSAVLCGHSMGGAVALDLALSRPGLVPSLLLVGSGARLRVSQSLLSAVSDQFHHFPQLMGHVAFSPATPRPVVEAYLSVLFDAPREVVVADLEACNRYDAGPRLGGLRAQVRLLVGADDQLTPPALARRMAERVDGARLEVVEHAGHMLPQERSDLVAAALVEMTAQGEGSVG